MWVLFHKRSEKLVFVQFNTANIKLQKIRKKLQVFFTGIYPGAQPGFQLQRGGGVLRVD